MIRREAITALLAFGAAAASFGARPQAKVAPQRRSIAYLSLEPALTPYPTPEQWRQRSLSYGMRNLGWDEGRNLVIERAYADLKSERLPALAASLVRKRVDVILANGPEASVAAARATKLIPIVAFNLVWPEEQELIRSFARPGRNVTGVSFYTGIEATTKRLEFLREVAPAAKRLSWLWPYDYEETVSGKRFDMSPALNAAAKALGFELRLHPLRRSEDIGPALAAVRSWHAQAFTASSEYVLQERRRVIDFARQQRLPSAFSAAEMVEAGGLLSYGVSRTNLVELFNAGLEYVDRILRGARPAELPVQRPIRFELVVNLATARTLGVTIPQSVLLRAGSVIE